MLDLFKKIDSSNILYQNTHSPFRIFQAYLNEEKL